MTGRELVARALRLIGAYAPGESIGAQEATDGLASINDMIESWSTESLIVYAIVREEFSMVAGTQTYTMGTGATFSTSRPVRIVKAGIEDQSGSPDIEYPIDILTVEEWADIVQKETGNSIPTCLYPEGTFPNETLNYYPKPSSNLKAVIYSEKPLTEIATLDTVISLPPGYKRALVFNGALELAPEYGKGVPDVVMKGAMESKAAIKSKNSRPHYLKCDPALVGNGIFNIYTGEYNR